MAKRRKRRKGETFGTEVRRQFGPVADRFGLEEIPGRAAMYSGVTYVRDGLRYSWSVDPREGCMWVHILLDRDERHSCQLEHLVDKHRSDSERVVLHDNTKTWLVLQRAVESHTLWIERFHARLVAPDAPEFILTAGGKLVMPDAARWRPCSS